MINDPSTTCMRWRLTVDLLRGMPLPRLPDLPGRRHRLIGDDLGALPLDLPPCMTPRRVEVLLHGHPDHEAARQLGITRQRAQQLRRELFRAIEAAD